EPVEVGDRAELGRDSIVPPVLVSDRPRAAGVGRLRGQRVVPALAARSADRMDRREVDDIEAELGERRQHLLHAGEAAERAREELVPRAEARELAVDLDAVGRASHGALAVRRRRRESRLHVELRDPEQLLALRELPRQVFLAGLDLPAKLVAPRRLPVAPRLDRVLPATAGGDLERAGEDVVADRL